MAECIRQCNFNQTGKKKIDNNKEKLESACSECGHVVWLEAKYFTKKDNEKPKRS